MGNPIAPILIAAVIVSSCGPSTSYQRDPSAPIASGTGWAWGAPDNDGLTVRDGALVPADSVASMIARAIEEELSSRGFARVSRDQAAFIVHFHVAQRLVTDTLPLRDDPNSGLPAPGSWGGYGRLEDVGERTVTWEEGMLIVDAVTSDGRTVAWRGTIAGEIPAIATERPEAAIRAAVRRLLRRFP